MFDLSEALEIGRKIGEKIIIIGSSTGGTLAAVGASEKNVSGIILVSPNFKTRYRFFHILTLGFARFWVPLIIGKYIRAVIICVRDNGRNNYLSGREPKR